MLSEMGFIELFLVQLFFFDGLLFRWMVMFFLTMKQLKLKIIMRKFYPPHSHNISGADP